MTWRARIWTRIAAAFTALMALLLAAGSGLAQEFDYTLAELEEKRRAESVWNHIHVLGQA